MKKHDLTPDPLDREDLNQIGGWIKDLSEEEPSMAWRAELNARLEELAPAPKRLPWWRSRLVWSSTASLAAIGALALFVLRPSPTPERADLGGLTATAIVNAHVESVTRHDLGLATATDLKADQGAPEPHYDWDVVDLDLL
jgi:anti-sigma-K factor RskA